MSRKASVAFLLSVIIIGSNLVVMLSPGLWFLDNPQMMTFDTHITSDVDIVIESDDDWTTYSWPGNGSAKSPYVIENLILGVVNIFTSTSHFVIRNCEITGEVFIEDSSNGTLENIILREFAVFQYLSDFLFQNLTRENGGGSIGITIAFSENFTFQHSRVAGVYNHGLILEECTNGLIQENTFSENGDIIPVPPPKLVAHDTSSPEFRPSEIPQVPIGGALEVDTCSNIMISDNIFIDNIGGGILAKDSTNLTILSNNETMSARGFGFSSSTRVNVSDNHADRGVYFHNCNESIAANNILGFYGLELKGETMSHFLISESNNTVHGKPLLYLENRNNQSIENEQLGQVFVVNSTRINFQSVICLSSFVIRTSSEIMIEDSRSSSITIQQSNDCIIRESVFRSYVTSWETGIWLDNAIRCQVVDNLISYTSKGLNIHGPSNGALVANNTITDVYDSGIRVDGVNNARIENNTVSYCAHTYVESHSVHVRTAVILNMNNSLFVNNSIIESLGHGIYLTGVNNTLFGNTIAGNEGRNAEDDGSNNQWDNGVSLGNFWGDYSGVGYYYIPGLAQSVDRFPRQAPGYEFSGLIAVATPVTIGSIAVVLIVAIFLYPVMKRRRRVGND